MESTPVIETSDVENKDYLQQVKKIVICYLCKGILVSPRQCTSCSTVCCIDCFTEWEMNHTQCPDGCRDFQTENASQSILRILNKLSFIGGVTYEDKVDEEEIIKYSSK